MGIVNLELDGDVVLERSQVDGVVKDNVASTPQEVPQRSPMTGMNR